MSKKILRKGTEVFLSEKGYYNYYYVNIEESFQLLSDVEVELLPKWTSARPPTEQWQAYIMPWQKLSDYPNRPCNVIWVKQ